MNQRKSLLHYSSPKTLLSLSSIVFKLGIFRSFFLLAVALIFSHFDIAAQVPGSPCFADRWEQGASWADNGCGVNDDAIAPSILGIVPCGNSMDTQSGLAENTTYDPSVFTIVPTTCVDPNTLLPVSISAPFTGQRISWFNFDVRPFAGMFDFQAIAEGDYELEWALYYSIQDTCGTGSNGLSGDCAVLSEVIACGTDFTDWSTQPFLTPIFGASTNLYLAVWRRGATNSINDEFEFTFSARYGCGDFCSVGFDGDPIISCNPDGTYQVVQRLNGTNTTVTVTAPGSTAIITDPTPLTFTTADTIPNSNYGIVTVSYPAGVDYNIIYTPFGEGLLCLPISSSGTAPNCCIMPVCSIDGPELVCPGDSAVHCGPVGASGYLWAISGDGIIIGATTGQCVTVSASSVCNSSYSVRLTVDLDSCISICTQNVTIYDSIAPVIICPEVVSPIYCPTIPVFPLPIVSDACDLGVTLSFSEVTLPGLWMGEFTVTGTWTATDSCGNSSSCSSIINILDNVAPVLSCPTVISPIACGSAIDFGIATAIDACDPDVDVTFADVTVQGACPQSYSVTRTWMAMDNTMNSSACSRTIVVQDTTPPVIVCPVVVSPIPCGAIPSFGIATVTDLCDTTVEISFSDVTIPGVCSQEYTVTRTWTATDDCNNVTTCSATIIVGGSAGLIITCPADINISGGSGVPAIDISLIEISGNCGAVTVIHLSDVITNDSCVNFVLVRTYQAIDACGQEATCSQIITMSDTTAPILSFPITMPQVSGDTIQTQCYGQNPEWDIPAYNADSIIVTDNSVEDVIITYNISLEDEGQCAVEGYINLYRLDWTATDACGNSSSAHLFLALVDNIPPVLEGVPANITVNCENIPAPPSVYATDECLCACVVFFQETEMDPTACLDGLVILRTWTATDRCGNETVDTQRITLTDELSPIVNMVHPELIEYANGSVIEYSCAEGGIPSFFDLIDANAVSGVGACDSNAVISFIENVSLHNNCDIVGYLEQREYTWTATDPCGNTSVMSINVRLIDNEAPVITGLPAAVCIGDPILNNIEVYDNCSHVTLSHWDAKIPNPCGEGFAQRRVYEAYDDCGNIALDTVILLPLTQNQPVLLLINPELAQLDSGLVEMSIHCDAIGDRYTTFGIDDVRVEGICEAGATIEFTETILNSYDCIPGQSMATVELKWTATEACGAYTELIIIAEIIDEVGPQFINFQPELSIRCDDRLPESYASDNCGEVTITYTDKTLQGACVYEYDIIRRVTATDLCGNTTIREQTIHVGNEDGPVFTGIEEHVCNDLSVPEVLAYDPCANQYVTVTMIQDTLPSLCRDGLVIVRTWSATDACGTTATRKQTIVMNDQTEPVILAPSYSVIQFFMDEQNSTVYHSQIALMAKLNAIDINHVEVSDNCFEQIIPVFTVNTLGVENCREQRTYTWIATDICGNADTLTFTVDIIDDLAPEFEEVIYDTLIICAPLPPAPAMTMIDTSENVTIVYTETQEVRPGDRQITVVRTWIATDSCQNSATYAQQIIWNQESTLECALILPDDVDCNSHGVVIRSNVSGGVGPYTYEWEVVGEKCFIQGGQGTPVILIYVGWADVKVILNVTDSFGCVTMCMVSLECNDISILPLTNAFDDTNILAPEGGILFHTAQVDVNRDNDKVERISFWPNPADEVIHISFESEIDGFVNFFFTDYLGKVIQKQRLMVHKGTNVQEIDASVLPNGSYMIQIQSEMTNYTRGVIILHQE